MDDEKLIEYLDEYLFEYAKIKKNACEDLYKSKYDYDKNKKIYDNICDKYDFIESVIERLEGLMCWEYDCHRDIVCNNEDCPSYKEYYEEMDKLKK